MDVNHFAARDPFGAPWWLLRATSGFDVHHRSYACLGFEQPEDVVVMCRSCHTRHHRVLALDAVRATDREPVKAPMVPASSIRWLRDA